MLADKVYMWSQINVVLGIKVWKEGLHAIEY